MARLAAKLTISGVATAMRRLQAAGDAGRHPKATMDELAAAAPGAISGVPEDTGRLTASIHDPAHPEHVVQTADDGYRLGTAVPYGRLVFGGTRYQPATAPRIVGQQLTDDAARALAREIADAGR